MEEEKQEVRYEMNTERTTILVVVVMENAMKICSANGE